MKFLGFVTQEELSMLYKKALATIYASYLGPNNLPPLESMALDCPVICANISGMVEQLSDSALFFDPKSGRDLANVVVSIIDNKELIHYMKKKGQKLANILSMEVYVKKIHQVIDELKPIERHGLVE